MDFVAACYRTFVPRLIPAQEGGAIPPSIAVIGPSGEDIDPAVADAAARVGALIAQAGAILVCGGGTGAMAAACRGANEAGGVTVGILPGVSREEANPWVSIAIPTGMGEARNALVVRAGDAVIAVGGGVGTLSEIALALKMGRPVIGLGTWEARLPPFGGEGPEVGLAVHRASSAEGAVAAALGAEPRSQTSEPNE
ncbi:MAG: TIGR00725 family protein [Actinomycetota bacterium]